MKILHITNTIEEGGVESLLFGLTAAMKQAGHEVAILSLRPGNDLFVQQFEQKGIPIDSCSKGRKFYSLKKLIKIIRLIRSGQYDVVHVHLFPSQYYGAVSSLFCNRKNTLIGTTEHGMVNRRRGKRWLRSVERWMYRRFDFVVGVSRTATDSLQQWLGEKPLVVTIENGIDLKNCAHTDPQTRHRIRESLCVPVTAKVLIMVARFYEAKDHDTVIRSMVHLTPNHQLLLVGSGPREQHCKTLAHKLGVSDRVHFVGHTDRVHDFISAADIGILASHHEGCPMSLVEYMAQGLPIVGSDIESIRLVMEEAGYLFRNGDAVALAECINSLTTDPVLYAEKSRISKNRSAAFDLSLTADKYLQLYHNTESVCKSK